MEDITLQRAAEEALVNSEKNYRELFDSGPLPKFIYALDSLRILAVNEAAVTKYGYSREELLQLKAIDLRPEEEQKQFKDYIEKLASSCNSVTEYGTHKKKNGELIKFEFTAVNLVYEGKQAVLGTINDITEKLATEEKLAQANCLQKRAITEATIKGQEQEREQLGRELHDNINQVLTTTKLYLECAMSNEPVRMEMIEKSRDALVDTITELRALTKLLMPSVLDHMNIVEAMTELINSYKATQQFGISFKHSGNLANVSDDIKLAVFRIAQEQLNNISKHAYAKTVDIKLSAGDYINLCIKDDGGGFDPSVKRKGVGITNMKNRANLFNGNVSIVSSLGWGCVMRLKIPVTQKEDTSLGN
jgi:PAS domain S-box-containing protein